jgi:hypothetical protein
MLKLKKNILFVLISSFMSTISVFAQSEITDEVQSEEHSADAHLDKNHLAVFVGGTSQVEKKGTHFSLGLDYLRGLTESRQWAAGGFAEVIFTKHPEWLFGALLFYQPAGTFWIRTGPGIEFLTHEETDPECNCVYTTSHTEILYRIGVGYSFHTKNLTFAPSVDIDFVRSTTAVVWGLNIGKSF